MTDRWETLSSTEHFANDHVAVTTDCVRSPARAEAREWTVVRRKSAVVVAPITAEGNLVLIRQERIAIRDTIWEMPAGQVDELCGTGSFKDVAMRELQEETGYELAAEGELIFLGDFFSSAGFTDERAFLFLARPVHRSARGPAHDTTETIIDCKEFPFASVSTMIAENEIRDANTLSTFARLSARGLWPAV